MKTYAGQLHSFIGQTDEYVKLKPSFNDQVKACLQVASWGVGRFIQIHPFLNGNGRISRLLANYFFIRYGYGLAHFPPLPRPAGDYPAVMTACMAGDFVPPYRYLLVLLATQSN
jgi:hypothetical protein